jgi:ABC-type transport system involved in cytochrome bd biosynthesis fused ATPase/permease subunit
MTHPASPNPNPNPNPQLGTGAEDEDRGPTEEGIELSESAMPRRDSLINRGSNAKGEMKIDLSFQNLSVTLVNKLRILNDVTGTLESGKMTAIMGPSGCGKSTLLNALTNRIKGGGKTGGRVWINGERSEPYPNGSEGVRLH